MLQPAGNGTDDIFRVLKLEELNIIMFEEGKRVNIE